MNTQTLNHDVWVNTKWRARGRIHEPGCKWYGIGHGYMTRRPPAEAVHCKLCLPGKKKP